MRLLTFVLLALIATCSFTSRCVAGGGPQNVVLIVNPDDPNSLQVANAYVELRHIPDSNIIFIPWSVNARAVTGEQFDVRMLKPVLAAVESRGISDQIDSIAFSCGFPYLVDCAGLFPGKAFEKPSRPMTSLTSATFLYQFMQGKRSEMFEAWVNFYFSPTVDGATASRAFSRSLGWTPAGTAPAGGVKYFLATSLGVTHERGNTPSEIVESLRRSKASDGAAYRGTIYYMQNNDVRSRVRHGQFQAAVDELAAIGVKGVIESGAAPQNKEDVAGLTTGTSHLQLRSSGSTLLPGALVDNLTSAGGKMHRGLEPKPQTPISEFIRLGAAGASGAVIEPYAIPAKFPSPALHVHYARGCSLAESFYQSIVAPYHLLIIGDPLCQPWAKPPAVSVEGVDPLTPLSGVATLAPTAKYPDARKASRFELFLDGVRLESIAPGGTFTLDTKGHAAGWHDVRIVAIDDTPIEVQGAWQHAIQFKGGPNALQLMVDEPRRFAFNESVRVTAAATAPGKVTITHLGRVVGIVDSGGALTIDPKTVGRGQVTLRGEQEGSPSVRSRPVTIEIY